MTTKPIETCETTRMARRVLAWLAAGVLAVSLVGCGSDRAERAEPAEDVQSSEASVEAEPLDDVGDDRTESGDVRRLVNGLVSVAGETWVADEQPVVPSSRLSDSPGAPQVIQEVQEREADASPTLVTDPNPTVTTVSPVATVGLQFAGGGGGGPFNTSNGDEAFGAKVFGSSGVGREIVFVIDASGSMVDVLPLVVNDLVRVADNLRPGQAFTVIVFSGQGVHELPAPQIAAADEPDEADSAEAGEAGEVGAEEAEPEPAGGVYPATAQRKALFREWVRLENFHYSTGGRGSQHAQAAIVRALSYEPQLIFLLSDNLTGGGQGASQHEIFQDQLMQAIREANDAQTPARINTVQFLYPDPLVEAGLTGTMQLIAEQTDGRYRFIGADDLSLE